MSLFDRMKTSVKADAHGVIDALEDRRLLLRQYVRDAEAELGKKRAHLQALELDMRALERESARGAQQLAELEADAELALSAGEDALARHTLRRLLGLRGRQRRNAERSAELARQKRELDQKLREQSEQYEELKARVEAELAASGTGFDAGHEVVSDEQVELELLRRKRAVEVKP
jgi:phage shock protein A